MAPATRPSKKPETNRGLYPDEILFHELVHALRGTSAQYMSLIPLSGGLKRYDSREEFIAVLATNIYISDPSNRSKTGLRRDHIQYTPLEKGSTGRSSSTGARATPMPRSPSSAMRIGVSPRRSPP